MQRDTRGNPSQGLALKLMKAVTRGSIARVREVLAEGASVDGTKALRPIAMAANRANLEMVKFLLKNGADANAPSDPGPQASEFILPFPGSRALHFVAGLGRVDIVRVLLQAGADPNAVNADGLTPLMAGCGPGDKDAELLTAFRSNNPKHETGFGKAWACQGPWMETERELLEAGADPLMTDKDGYLTLHTAAVVGNVDLVSMLLSITPHTVNQQTAHQETALYLAAKEGHAAVVDRLLSAGATHPMDSQDDMSPIVVAVCLHDEEVLRVLIEKGSDTVGGLVRQLPVTVVTALAQGHARILHQVFTAARGGEDGRLQLHRYAGLAGPVLHYAAGYCIPISVRLLLAEGADESVMDSLGQRARDVVGTMDKEYPPWNSRIDPTLPKTRERDPVQEALILRLLEQGPAFRATSWAWPAGPSACSAAAETVSKRPPHKGAPSVRLLGPTKDIRFFAKCMGR